MSLLRETALAVGSELDLDKVFALIVERARELIHAETVLLPLINQNCDEYTYRAGSGNNVDEIVGESLPIDLGVCGWVWKNKRPWWRGALSELSEQERNLWEKDAGTLLLVPLYGRHHFLGGISCLNKKDGREFTENDLHLLELFAGQAAIAIENAMAMARAGQAKSEAEIAQNELQRVNKRLLAANQELEYITLYDNLTGLPNRSLFRDRIRKEIDLPDGAGLALLIVDINGFQEVNDGLGHEAGDELLRVVAERLGRELDPADTIARMSGDEFAVLLANANDQSAMSTARNLLAALDKTMNLAGQEVLVTAGIGIALFPQHGNDISTLFKNADAAMLAAKRDKSGVHLFDAQRDAGSPGRLALVRDLRAALDAEEFELYYQPKVELATNTIIGVEALARWRRSDGAFVPTDMFIVALEQTGLIQRFTWWALETVMIQRLAWLERRYDLRIAVNMPISVLTDPEFINGLGTLVDRYKVRGGITIEITENIFFGDYDRLNAVLSELRRFNIECSIDDFGTGYSSLARLRQLPVAELKIDRSFVMDMLRSKDDAVIVKSTIDLGHNLGLKVVAEGVENAKTLQQLYRLRCDSAQGYYISKALPVAELEVFIGKSKWAVARTDEIGSANQMGDWSI
ncbi:MAG: bifunctional diguanylate cyclase/phosphodiesterase [Sulfuritalea sp.]|nr:bifunctional diguanylate cyclase/phosphodiesterase [Sulfuritalea sp.]